MKVVFPTAPSLTRMSLNSGVPSEACIVYEYTWDDTRNKQNKRCCKLVLELGWWICCNDCSHIPCLLPWLSWQTLFSCTYISAPSWLLGDTSSTTLLEIYQDQQLHYLTVNSIVPQDYSTLPYTWILTDYTGSTLHDPTVKSSPIASLLYYSTLI